MDIPSIIQGLSGIIVTLMAFIANSLHQRLEKHQNDISLLKEDLSSFQTHVAKTYPTNDSVEKRFDRMEAKFDRTDEKIDKLLEKIELSNR